jgi:hypothetical protein
LFCLDLAAVTRAGKVMHLSDSVNPVTMCMLSNTQLLSVMLP